MQLRNLLLFFVLFSFGLVFAQEYKAPITVITDPLRDFGNFISQFDLITKFVVLVLTVFIFFVAFKAYKKSDSPKLKLVLIAFGLFLFKWILKVVDVFVSPGIFFNPTYENVVELLILGFLFWALFKK